jgi:hypothetical protein
MMTGEDPHTAADREWFASNPGRRAYLRPPAGLSELQLLANRAALSVLRSGVPEATIEHVRQQMQQTIAAYHRDPSSVAMLVAQVEPGVRVRHPMQLQPGEAINTIAPHDIEQAALGLLDGQDAQALSQRYPDVSHVEAQLLPTAMLAAAANKQTCPLDIAAAEGQARHATKH